MLTSRPRFPHVLDNTLISAFRSCPQQANRAYFEHWKPQGTSVHLHAGAAYAHGLEVMRRAFYSHEVNAEDALALGGEALLKAYGDFECPEGSAKSAARMLGALEFYTSQYPLDKDPARPLVLPSGHHAIEFSFAQPLDIQHPETGDPLIYCGRSDMIVQFAGGTYVEDDKTTSSLGATWSKQWDLRSQFIGYCWAAREAGISVNGVLVRGVSILKTKYDTQQAIVYFSDWEIERWQQQLRRDIHRMMDCWEEGYWDFNLADACSAYGGCEFKQVCKSPTPQTWLPVYFEQRVWDPLERTETPLADWEARQ
jgi:hypothetical protein